MKRICLFAVFFVFLYSCKNHEAAPDVSQYHAATTIRRFDQDFFSIDTNRLEPELNRLQARYPDFFPQYLVKILGINPADPAAGQAIKTFIASYGPVFAASQKMANKSVPVAQKDIEQALRYLQHYVTGYKPDSPFVITTFLGPMDAFEPFPIGDYGDVRTANGVGIALQLHLGRNEPLYEDGRQAGVFFDYQLRRFTPETMAVNAAKNLVLDAFPYTPGTGTLVDEMIEKGKRLYVVDKILPNTDDSLKLGYTTEQLKGCYANEALIWNFFVKNDLLYSKEASINQSYIKDGPKTQELGEGAPGYIGLFTGLQIVRAYIKKHPETSIPDLMKKPATQVLEEAAYKP